MEGGGVESVVAGGGNYLRLVAAPWRARQAGGPRACETISRGGDRGRNGSRGRSRGGGGSRGSGGSRGASRGDRSRDGS